MAHSDTGAKGSAMQSAGQGSNSATEPIDTQEAESTESGMMDKNHPKKSKHRKTRTIIYHDDGSISLIEGWEPAENE